MMGAVNNASETDRNGTGGMVEYDVALELDLRHILYLPVQAHDKF